MAEEKEVKKSKTRPVFWLVLAVAILFLVYSYRDTIYSYSKSSLDSLSKGASSILKPFSCLINPTQCQTAYTEIWETPKAATPETSYVKVDFENTVARGGKVDVIAALKVKALEPINIKPSCELDDYPINTALPEATTSILNFQKSSSEQHSSIECSGETGVEKSSYQLKLKLERSSKINAIWPVWLGSSSSKMGIVKSEMPNKAPYSLDIVSFSDQPFKDGKYDFYVRIKREEAETKLKSIESLKLSTISGKLQISCNDFGSGKEAKIEKLNRTQLEKYRKKEIDEGFQFKCELEVSNAPSAGEEPESNWIEAKAEYTVESAYAATVTKVA